MYYLFNSISKFYLYYSLRYRKNLNCLSYRNMCCKIDFIYNIYQNSLRLVYMHRLQIRCQWNVREILKCQLGSLIWIQSSYVLLKLIDHDLLSSRCNKMGMSTFSIQELDKYKNNNKYIYIVSNLHCFFVDYYLLLNLSILIIGISIYFVQCIGKYTRILLEIVLMQPACNNVMLVAWIHVYE